MTTKHSINFNVKNDSFFINGDEDQLNRVFINLIKNSEEAFEDMLKKDPNFKGIINIEIINNNDYITCRLTDNGPGITDAKKAMTPYFTTKKKGTGLGLPIVTKIINEHFGNFSIKSWGESTSLERVPIKSNELLIFSSHLIHGIAHNPNDDITRISFEFRLYEKL